MPAKRGRRFYVSLWGHYGRGLLTKCPVEIFKPLFERFPRAGDVDALESAAACAEDRTVVEPEVRLADDFVVEL